MSGRVILPQLTTGDILRGSGVFSFGPPAPPDVGWLASATIDLGNVYGTQAATVAPDGSIYLGGSVTIAGNRCAWLAKFDASGAAQWTRARTIGTVFGCGFSDLDTDAAGNVYGTGWISNGAVPATWVAKWDSTGALLWQRRLTGATDTYEQIISGATYTFVNGLGVTDAGDVYVSTSSRATGPLTGLAPSAVIAKWNTSGALQWRRWVNVGGTNTQGHGVAVNKASGDAYQVVYNVIQAWSPAGVAGATVSLSNFTGDWWIGARCDTAGNIYAGGLIRDAAIDPGWWLCKFDATLALQWQRQLFQVGGSCDAARPFVNGAGTRVGIAGVRPGPSGSTAGVAVYDGSGALQWQRRMTDSASTSIALGGAFNASNQPALPFSADATGTGAAWRLASTGSPSGTYSGLVLAATPALTDAPGGVAPAAPVVTTAASTLTESAATTANVAFAPAWSLVTIP